MEGGSNSSKGSLMDLEMVCIVDVREKVMSLPLSALIHGDAGRLLTTALQSSVPIVDLLSAQV